ncbi:Putative epoxide hydrolase OS=Stigmatella aurantiaca (strain DW4/3-1) GN=STAUR_4299 PE=3 SV=2 [Rhizoctonia solani AG-1 IB]|uniref:Putative epoxide hydrolase n=1 Tax=Thanatephorus cucumeris (strain AG1-IB / isolate 7/3/14) TaxID=1108050 RepID=A0A0B7FX79_THACB|nr:Putative epoxide hydrolase OS=Stigmatella aurantiaca (strain DW4/3-1) GN=STAUR_4299 PE=3 SV=2 [Rhizoctonia solani AG-1 IB]
MLIQQTRLPETSILGNSGRGTELSWLRDRQKDWLERFDWVKEQKEMNRFNHSTVDIGNMTVHFIHQRSPDPHAIPLLLTHGWPGSFYEFHQVIGPLINPGNQSNVSFHVVVPSLPGFGFSSPAPPGWTLNKTADLFDSLLTEVLGYKSYAAVGGDWGSVVTWGLHNNHPEHVKAVLYTGLIPQMGPSLDKINNDPNFANVVTRLEDTDKQRIQSNSIFPTDGWGYFLEQSTRPATVGLALYDNPIGQLSWIGEKYLFGDPLMGSSPSTLTNNTIITTVSLYYLSQTFETSVNTYYQNPNEFPSVMRRAANNIPMGFASYRYEAQYYPQFYLSKIGNLVYYSDHERGGHFSALDNPPAYLADLRNMMSRWYTP